MTRLRTDHDKSSDFSESYFKGDGSGYVGGYRIDGPTRMFFENQIAKIRKYTRKIRKVCEVGCAYGYLLSMMERSGWQVYGTDVSEYAISKASKYTHAVLKVHDIESGPPYPNEQFDVIFCLEVIEHLYHPERALEHMYSNLRNGGILILTTPNKNSLGWRRILLKTIDRDTSHVSLKGPKEWSQLVEECGFSVLSLETSVYLPPTISPSYMLFGILMRLVCALRLGHKIEIAVKKPNEVPNA